MNLELDLERSGFTVDELSKAFKPMKEFLMYYSCAMEVVKTKIDVLNSEFEVKNSRNPVESVQSRLKEPASIISKLDRLGHSRTLKDAEAYIFDIAGVRIICSFIKDIYMLAGLLMKQEDMKLVRIKDYIRNPKPNGYRSLHLLLSVPIQLSDGKKDVIVEVQIRTAAMDLWASIEHKISYKKDFPGKEKIVLQLLDCASKINEIDDRLEKIDEAIEGSGDLTLSERMSQ
ncbi:MAG: GTP pyrophosphokinase family protein [Sphaerochaetaceae bacterium]|nr:GTP pyrophosphokinase family protein [Sphaerochaetaceae bacterium]MDD3163771.1 GTP pyrophosphokinase family protein [Sphaerochaetaceae bacterium]MDD4007443.1 GTP pyrophosphokinase family protein [Sphaerochaetaceae bacterium]MDD4396708.1 GTP pyrophosphokinase family protein [Sphaerochaetaceae bacterium]